MIHTSVQRSIRVLTALAVGSALLTACGGGGVSVALPTTDQLSVTQVNQVALAADPNSMVILTAGDAAAPSDVIATAATISTDTTAAPAATTNDAAAPSDNV